jgi:hypothetical protein
MCKLFTIFLNFKNSVYFNCISLCLAAPDPYPVSFSKSNSNHYQNRFSSQNQIGYLSGGTIPQFHSQTGLAAPERIGSVPPDRFYLVSGNGMGSGTRDN